MLKKFTSFIRLLYEKEVEKTDKMTASTDKQISLPKEQIGISMRDELKESEVKMKDYENKEKKQFLQDKLLASKSKETNESKENSDKDPKLKKKRLRD